MFHARLWATESPVTTKNDFADTVNLTPNNTVVITDPIFFCHLT